MLPVVLVHGILDGPHLWDAVAGRLRSAGRSLTVVRSIWEGDPSPQAEAARLAKEIPSAAHLVGHSRGGTSASWLAVDRPDLVASLAVIASPPHASEVFRAAFRDRLSRAPSAPDPDALRRVLPLADAAGRAALEYLAAIPDEDFPQDALRKYRGRALVVEYEDDPLYSPTQTMFWRMFLPYADMERVPGGHRAFADDTDAALWLADRLLSHFASAER